MSSDDHRPRRVMTIRRIGFLAVALALASAPAAFGADPPREATVRRPTRPPRPPLPPIRGLSRRSAVTRACSNNLTPSIPGRARWRSPATFEPRPSAASRWSAACRRRLPSGQRSPAGLRSNAASQTHTRSTTSASTTSSPRRAHPNGTPDRPPSRRPHARSRTAPPRRRGPRATAASTRLHWRLGPERRRSTSLPPGALVTRDVEREATRCALLLPTRVAQERARARLCLRASAPSRRRGTSRRGCWDFASLARALGPRHDLPGPERR